MSAPPLRSARIEHSLVLTIDREAAGNSLSAETAAAIRAAIAPLAAPRDPARHDPDAPRTVILTGAGDKFFCAGGDIKRYRALRNADQVESVFQGPRDLMDDLEALPVPVIAAVNGYALGGGAELMLAADLRLAASTASIGFPQARLGIIPGFHGIARLARDVGHPRAMRLLLTGERLSAAAAEALGLVQGIVEGTPVLEAALDLARSLEACGPLAMAGAKQVLHSVGRRSHEDSRALADEVLTRLWLSDDHREAEAAFEDKRAPCFRGR